MDTLQIITEPHRREILRLVWDRDLIAGEIAENFDITFGAVSQHLGVLRDAGFVRVTKDGNRRVYRADKAALGDFRSVLESIWATALDSLVSAIEEDHPIAEAP